MLNAERFELKKTKIATKEVVQTAEINTKK